MGSRMSLKIVRSTAGFPQSFQVGDVVCHSLSLIVFRHWTGSIKNQRIDPVSASIDDDDLSP